MKRLALTLTLIVLAGTAWTAFDAFRLKHPVSGKEIVVPGQNGANALLVSGWKTTPAGRQLASGDMWARSACATAPPSRRSRQTLRSASRR